MSMLGKAALAMWWNVAPETRAELEHWHAHEHFPERLAIPGFLRGSRWTAVDDGEGFFVMYELQDHAVLASAPYVARLNAPSRWSTQMMPLHLRMVRTQCKVVHSQGAVTARHALTLRCSSVEADAQSLQRGIVELAESAVQRPGIVGMHLLHHEAPSLDATTEQRIRGNADRAADWVVVTCAYDLGALQRLATEELGQSELRALGCADGSARNLFGLAYSATPADVH
jgi:hypothetical protein